MEKHRRKIDETLAKHSKRFYEQLFRPAFPVPSVFQLMVFRMGRTSIRQMLGESDRDFTWYRNRGWFDSDYYYPTRLGAIKRAAGAAFDWMAGRLFNKEAA